MFNVRPNLRAPGFNVREPEEEVPGFRLNADGTIGKPPMTAAKPDGNPFDIFEPQPRVPGHRRTWPSPEEAARRPRAAGERWTVFLPERRRRRAPGRWTPGQQPAFRSFDAARRNAGQMQSTGGAFSCTTPGGTSFGPLPAPKGFPATIGPDSGSHHQYRYKSAPFYNPKEVMRQAIERPTFGPSDRNSPATRDGTANEATPQPYHSIAEAVKAATGMHGFPAGTGQIPCHARTSTAIRSSST